MYEDIQAAIDRGTETESLEFKASLDFHSAGAWLEVIKDLVALANSGGGAIVFGVEDSGQLSGFDCSTLEDLDPGELTDKLNKYTGQQFHGFDLVTLLRGDTQALFSIVVSGAVYPLVFSKPGTYDIGGGKQKTAFSLGTVYFRHGAKSEPGNSDDLRHFVDQRVEQIRKSWMDGIAKSVSKKPPNKRLNFCFGMRYEKEWSNELLILLM
jgi:predicted HTH transcriptional regulator